MKLIYLYLIFPVPPTALQEVVKKYTASISDDLDISCMAEAYPSPHISWRQLDNINGTFEHTMKAFAVDQFISKGILELRNIQSKDFGQYECTAHNLINSTSVIITIEGNITLYIPFHLRGENSKCVTMDCLSCLIGNI